MSKKNFQISSLVEEIVSEIDADQISEKESNPHSESNPHKASKKRAMVGSKSRINESECECCQCKSKIENYEDQIEEK